jgi:probable rRNA maturation factor
MEFRVKEQVYQYENLTFVVRDTQHKRKFILRQQKRMFNAFLQELKKFLATKLVVVKHYDGLELSLTLSGRKMIRSYNQVYRNKDKVTDVLSFPLFDNLRIEGEFLPPYLELGDIFICREVAIRQAKEYELTLEQEVLRQLIHGTLHLLGFDHEVSKDEEQIMFKHEEKMYNNILKSL